MKKFITPVSMRVTQEQFDRDLKKPLEELGYESDLPWNEFRILGSQYPFVSCQYIGVKPCYGFYNHDCSSSCHFIDDYNPELFLALASMTEGEEPIAGEYMYCKLPTTTGKSNGDIFKITRYEDGIDAKTAGKGDFGPEWSRVHYRKATKQELLDRFTKQEFVLPEKWYIKITDENKGLINGWKVKQEYDDDLYLYKNYKYVASNGAGVAIIDRYRDDHTEITFDQFKKYVLKQDKTMKYKVTRKQMNEIFNIACSSWKEKIVKITNDNFNAFSDESELDYRLVKEMFDAANSDQKKVLESIFGKFEEDKNAFVRGFDSDFLDGISKELFGGSFLFQIGGGSIPSSMEHLSGRSFYVSPSLEVLLHKGNCNSTIIEIRKK